MTRMVRAREQLIATWSVRAAFAERRHREMARPLRRVLERLDRARRIDRVAALLLPTAAARDLLVFAEEELRVLLRVVPLQRGGGRSPVSRKRR